MSITEIEDEKIWEQFVHNFSPNNFLTSWSWANFNKEMGNKPMRLGLWKENELVGVCLTIRTNAKRGNFLLCPAGPILKDFSKKNFELFVKRLRQIAQKEKVGFIRIRPLGEVGEFEKTIRNEGFRPSPTFVHAQVSWILDITKSPEELLAGMKKSTRYLVRYASKKGIRVEEKNSLSGVRIFEDLQKETVQRHVFTPFSNKYLEKEFEVFSKKNQIKILIAYRGQRPLAAAMIIFYGDSAFYHQGASVRTKLPATYLLQWEAIKTAKNLGKKYYNFWGIAPNDSLKHPWAGLTHFKKGFGGLRVEYTIPHDFPLSRMYPITYWFERFRNYKRGLG